MSSPSRSLSLRFSLRQLPSVPDPNNPNSWLIKLVLKGSHTESGWVSLTLNGNTFELRWSDDQGIGFHFPVVVRTAMFKKDGGKEGRRRIDGKHTDT